MTPGSEEGLFVARNADGRRPKLHGAEISIADLFGANLLQWETKNEEFWFGKNAIRQKARLRDAESRVTTGWRVACFYPANAPSEVGSIPALRGVCR
jgi:hypothetical protein